MVCFVYLNGLLGIGIGTRLGEKANLWFYDVLWFCFLSRGFRLSVGTGGPQAFVSFAFALNLWMLSHFYDGVF